MTVNHMRTGNMSVYQVCSPARAVINKIVIFLKNKMQNKWQLVAGKKGFCFLTFTVLFILFGELLVFSEKSIDFGVFYPDL